MANRDPRTLPTGSCATAAVWPVKSQPQEVYLQLLLNDSPFNLLHNASNHFFSTSLNDCHCAHSTISLPFPAKSVMSYQSLSCRMSLICLALKPDEGKPALSNCSAKLVISMIMLCNSGDNDLTASTHRCTLHARTCKNMYSDIM